MPPSRTAAEGRGHQLSEAGQRRTVIFGSTLILSPNYLRARCVKMAMGR